MANYHKGAADERYVIELARAGGCQVIRAAGSLGLADVVVFPPIGRRGMLAYAVNVKRNRWAPPDERATMVRAWRHVGVVPVLARVTIKGGNRLVTWRIVRSRGAMSTDMEGAPWA